MQLHTGHRSIPLVLKKSGQVPTLPHPISLKPDSNGWKETDLADGEYCINNIDRLFYYRMYDQIYVLNYALTHNRQHALNSTLDHTSTIPQNHIMDADINGLPHDGGITIASILTLINNSTLAYVIPTGVHKVVANNHQYLIKDNLYLTGGSITLQGNAQLVIH